MADKDLRKMNRSELIETIYQLQQTAAGLEAENAQLKDQLEDHTIRIEQAGSLEAASDVMSDVFRNAQKAADEYLESLKNAADHSEEWVKQKREEAAQEAERIIAKAKKDAEAANERTKEGARACLSEAVIRSQKMKLSGEKELEATRKECEALKAKTDQDIAGQWKNFEAKVAEIAQRSSELKALLISTEQLNGLLNSR